MGISIGNKNREIDMGYGGFYNLRKNIAGIYSSEFKRLYEEWVSPCSKMTDEEGNKQLITLYENDILTDEDDVVLDFLFASDAGGKVSAKGCKRLYKIIKDYDDDILYGYIGRKDCAMFKDFKDIVKECAERRIILSWY